MQKKDYAKTTKNCVQRKTCSKIMSKQPTTIHFFGDANDGTNNYAQITNHNSFIWWHDDATQTNNKIQQTIM